MTPGAILILSELFQFEINNIYYCTYVLINWLIVPSYTTHTHTHTYIYIYIYIYMYITGFIKFTVGRLFAYVNTFSIFAYFALVMT